MKTVPTLITAIILAAAMLASAWYIHEGLASLADTVAQKSFDSPAPSQLSVQNIPDSPYLSVTEAAAYLRLTEDEVLTLIAKDEFDGYVYSGKQGYILSREGLDLWFKTAAGE